LMVFEPSRRNRELTCPPGPEHEDVVAPIQPRNSPEFRPRSATKGHRESHAQQRKKTCSRETGQETAKKQPRKIR
jgi:hypothetical protein